MDTIKNNVNKVEKKQSKVLEKIKEIKEPKTTLISREQKHNFIHSLRSLDNTLENVKFEVRMNEDFEQTFGPNVKLKKGKKYDFQVTKYDYHEDGKLAISCCAGGKNEQFKIFTDRFEILTDKKTIGNTGIIEESLVTIIKADGDLDGMGGFINKSEKGKGIASFRNLRGQNFYLLDGDEIEFYNTNINIVLGEKKDNRDEINKIIDSVEQGIEISEEKFNEIEKLFINGRYSEKNEDEHYKGNGKKIIFNSRDNEGDLDNQLEIIRKVMKNKTYYFIDYKY